MDDVTKNLMKFWDNYYKLTDADYDYFKNINEKDYLSLAPSLKQLDALRLFKNSNYVLDYGSGTGWASIIMAKEGKNKIKSVDVSPNSVKVTSLYAKAYNLENEIEAILIDEKWINNEKDNSYDGFFSSNVIDVIPLDAANNIIKKASRIIKPNSYVIFSVNYYISIVEMKKRGFKVIGNSAFIDGILRLTSLSDDEWIEIFNEYFKVIDVKHFAWPEEEEEKRRIFILKNNKL
jgi:SAM-dependent methyltransferase